jgi:hypothetical protein
MGRAVAASTAAAARRVRRNERVTGAPRRWVGG